MSESSNGRESKTRSRSNGASLIVREMTLQDLHAVFELGERLFTAERWPNLYRTWDEYELAVHFSSDSETCLVAEMDERVVGFALGTLLEKRHSAWSYGYLLWLGVDPDAARRGIASRLVARMTELFIEFGARMILVDTDAENDAALGFFRTQGFGQETPHVFLTKNLTNDPQYKRRRKASRSARYSPKPGPARVERELG